MAQPNGEKHLAIWAMRNTGDVLHPELVRRHPMATSWHQLSKEIKTTIDHAGKSIVAVDGRAGHTSSGIVWRKDFVITASHSIRQDTGIRVILSADQSVQARLAGRDRGSDIALLKLDGEVKSPQAEFGSTAELAVGDFTVAVARTRRGNLVASSGIISGLMGEWKVHRTRIDQFIRPDITLYPGFSGGALVGADSKLLGLNTSGFLRGKPITIPSSTLTTIAEQIAQAGHVVQPYLGLVMQPVQIPESLRTSAGVNSDTGLLVMHVERGAPADLAGVLIGDILLDIDGTSLDDLQDLHAVLDSKGVGEEVSVSLVRGGKLIQSAIKIGARP
jgi:S1-C subfamily serine protease